MNLELQENPILIAFTPLYPIAQQNLKRIYLFICCVRVHFFIRLKQDAVHLFSQSDHLQLLRGEHPCQLQFWVLLMCV